MHTSLRSALAMSVVFGVCIAAHVEPLAAQGGPHDTTEVRRAGAAIVDGGNACLNALPKDAGRPATAYLGIPASDTVAPGLRAQANNFAAVVVDVIRHELGAVGDTLPYVPALVDGRASSTVTLMVRRNGPLSWTTTDSARWSRRTRQLLLDALDSATKSGEAILWPEDVTGDSARVRLHIDVPSLLNGKLIGDESIPVAIPVYATRVLEEKPAAVKHSDPPRYPEVNRQGGWVGAINLQFVIDTTGHAEASTIKDIRPKDAPPLKPELTDIYDAFVQAAKASIPGSAYYPAEIAGCKVRQVVQQAFVFSLKTWR